MRKWMFVAVIAVVALIAVISLGPMALAQGPADGYGPGYGNRAMLNDNFGPGSRMGSDDASSPIFGMSARRNGATPGVGLGNGPGFIDENGDGVCDNFVDEDGDGVCDHAGEGGHGPGFVDEDGDGACDHAGAGRQAGRGGRMMGRWTQ